MIDRGKSRRLMSLLVAIVMVMGILPLDIYAREVQPALISHDLEDRQGKIDLAVLQDFDREEILEIMVYMSEQVDTERLAINIRNSVSKMMTPYAVRREVGKGIVQALKENAEDTQSKLLDYLVKESDKGNVLDYRQYHIINMVYVKASKNVVEEIATMKEVEKIYKNHTHMMERPIMDDIEMERQGIGPEWNISRVGADMAWDLGIDGTGTVVGIIDSGVDWTHPALKEQWRGYNPNTGETDSSKSWFDPMYNSRLPEDSDQHGTHVLGTMVGVEPNGANPVGVAPGAKWIGSRVFNEDGFTTDSILLSAAEWMLAPGGDPNAAPDVINNSWGGGDGIDDWYKEAIQAWRSAGIFPVFAAGNQLAWEPSPWPGSISIPSNYLESFAVAAVDKYDVRGSFSKLGPSPYDPKAIKPDISAPGVNIYSSIPGGGYSSRPSGTSMAAPHVSGIVALLYSIDASLTLDEIERILITTADPLADETYPRSPNFGYGHGMVNAYKAVLSIATGIGDIKGRVLKDGEDTEELVIEHEQEVFESYLGTNIEIFTRIRDDVAVVDAELLVRQGEEEDWIVNPMTIISGDHKDGLYRGVISNEKRLGDSIEYRIRARDYAGTIGDSNGYKIDIIFGVIPGEYIEGFEKEASGWKFGGDWQWGEAQEMDPKPYEGKGLAGTVLGGNYNLNTKSWMVTPPIDLRNEDLPNASLRFHHWSKFGDQLDRGYVLISNDYGETWTQVGPKYTDTNDQWMGVFVNLDSYIGSEDPIFLAFNFQAGDFEQELGWYIDNVQIIGKDEEGPLVPTSLTASPYNLGIKLEWEHSFDADVKTYRIYRSESSGGEYRKIGETSRNYYIDSDMEDESVYYYVIDAIDFSENVSKTSEEVFAVGKEVTSLFSSDFEQTNGGFISEGINNSWEWGIPTSGPMEAFSGERLWGTNLHGDYPLDSDSYITSPTIDVGEGMLPVLTFNHWVDMEGRTPSWDYGQIKVSKDNGLTWVNVTPGVKYGSRVEEWKYEEINLKEFIGESIIIKFYFYSDSETVYSGWYVDDVNVFAIEYVEEPIPEDEMITYDDGRAEDAVVVDTPYDGVAVKFTPRTKARVRGANVYLWGDDWPQPGSNRLGFAVFRTDGNGRTQQVGETLFRDDLVRGDWNYIDLSSLDFTTPDDFYISTIQDMDSLQHPGTGLDRNSPDNRSYLNDSGIMEPYIGEGAVMIRADVGYILDDSIEDDTSYNQDLIEDRAKNKKETILDLKDREVENLLDFSLKVDQIGKNKLNRNLGNQPVSVTSMAGIPLEDATVTIIETGRTVRTNPSTGEFNIKASEGDYTLRAEGYGYYAQETKIKVLENHTSEITFILEPRLQGSLTGRVIDRYHKSPIPNATVRIIEDPRVAPVITDKDGNFTISNIYEDEYTLRIISDGFIPEKYKVKVNGNETTNVDVQLQGFIGYEDEIAYDDGTAEVALVANGILNGLAVRFTPEYFGKVRGVKVYLYDSRWPYPGGNSLGFAIYETDERGIPHKLGDTIFIDDLERGGWNTIDLTDFNFSTDRDFYISTIQNKEAMESPGIGIDRYGSGERSYINQNGEFTLISDEDTEGGLMIRALMEYSLDIPRISNLKELTYTNQDSIVVEGTVRGDSKVNLYLNGEKIDEVMSEGLRFSGLISLNEGENRISVSGEINNKETEPSKPIRIIRDLTPPSLEVHEPLDNTKTNKEALYIKGSVRDNTEIEKLTINEKEIKIDKDGNYHERMLINDGENVIVVRATDKAGNETIIERLVILSTDVPQITDITPSEDVVLEAGETLDISFKAETGGRGYFKLLLPYGMQGESFGFEMDETNGVYSGKWIVPSEMDIESILVEVIYINEYGHQVNALAKGKIRVTSTKDINNLPSNTIILGEEAFHVAYLENNREIMEKLNTWEGPIYIKLDKDTLVDQDGNMVDIKVLPREVRYYDKDGNTKNYRR